MFRASLKGVWAHKLRLALTALAIVLGVGFISGTYIYTDTIGRAFDGIFADAFAGVDIVVSAESEFQFGEGAFMQEDDFDRISGVEGVEEAAPFIQGFGVTVLDKDGEQIGGLGPPQFGASLIETVSDTGGFALRDGSYPLGPDDLVLDAATADTGSYAIGDEVSVLTETTGEQTYTLVGIAGFGELDNLGGATFALFDLDTAQTILGRPGQLSGGSVQVVGGADVDAVIAEIRAVVPESIDVQSGQSAAEAEAAEIQEGLAFFNTFLLVFGFIALFVGTFIIYNTFRIIITQRTRELALFRALGATARQVFRMVLLEAIVVGSFASVLGIFAGLGIAGALQAGLAAFGVDLPSGSLSLQPRTIVVGLVVGIVVTLISATLPARRASRVPPAAALRDDPLGSPRKALTIRAIAGAAITALGLVALLGGLFGSIPGSLPEIAYVGLGAAIIFVGVSVISPLFARPVARVIGYPFARLLRVPGRLAQENAIRTPRRTSATAGALMIGITLVTLAATMAASIRGTVDDILGNSVEADLIVTSTNQFNPTAGFTPDVAARFDAHPDVADTTRLQVGAVLLDGSETFASGIEDDFSDYFPPETSEGSLSPGAGEVVVETAIAEANGWSVGSEVPLTFEATGEQTFTLVGTAEGDVWSGVIALAQDEWARQFGGVLTDSQVYVRAIEGVSPDQLSEALAPLIEEITTIQVQTLEELQNQAADQINQLLNLITGLLGLAVIIALIGVTNTMTLSVFERTREIGLLRAVGLTRRQTRRMIRSEASIIAVFGAVLGVIIGVFFGWAILKALEDDGFTVFVVPYGSILIWIIVTAILGIVFAILPAWRASKLNVLEAIAYE